MKLELPPNHLTEPGDIGAINYLDFIHRPYVLRPLRSKRWFVHRHQVMRLCWVRSIELTSIGGHRVLSTLAIHSS
jgi:hypothetical protein